MELPLSGVRVLEVGGGIAAGFAARLLSGYGADVARTEHAGRQPLTPEETAYLVAGKRRIRAEGEPLASLAGAADIVVEDHPPGTVGALGLHVAELRRQRPASVVVSLTPFGQDGPYAQYQANNAVSFAMGGIMSLTGDLDRAPLITGGSQAQYLGGLNGFAAAVAAYYGRLTQGEGDWVDISLQECATSMLELYCAGTSYGEPVALRTGNHVRAVWGIYPCVDGWGGVFCLERQIPALFGLLDDPDLDDVRFRDPIQRLDNDEELSAKLYAFFASHTKAELLELGRTHRIPFGAALTPHDLLADAGLAERGFFDDVALSEGAVRVPGRPFPGFGWHAGPLRAPGADTDAVARDWGSAR